MSKQSSRVASLDANEPAPVPVPYFLKLPSTSKMKPKKSFSSLFNGEHTGEDLSESKPRTRQNSMFLGKDGDQEPNTPKRRPSATPQRRGSVTYSNLGSRSTPSKGGDQIAPRSRASSLTVTTGKSLNDLIGVGDPNFIAPIRRQRNSISLFLKNSENRINGSRRSSIKDSSVEYNDVYLETLTEASKKLVEFCQESGEYDGSDDELEAIDECDSPLPSQTTPPSPNDIEQNNMNLGPIDNSLSLKPVDNNNLSLKPLTKSPSFVNRVRNLSFVNPDGSFLPMIRDVSHLMRLNSDITDDGHGV